jgi:hypothetical protein
MTRDIQGMPSWEVGSDGLAAATTTPRSSGGQP